MTKKKIIVIAGPTGVGKSKAAVTLCKRIGGEVISADSMQVYRGMDIGTAKIKKEEMKGIPHHLIDVLDIDKELSVSLYKKMADEAMRSIFSAGHIPVIAGGSGFYIQSLIYDIDFKEFSKDIFLEKNELNALSLDKLLEILKAEDPLGIKSIDIKNKRKIINAIIFKRERGYSIAIQNKLEKEKQDKPPFDIKYFVLSGPRSLTYERAEKRVDSMINDGLIDEVKGLMERGLIYAPTASKAIGYKELIGFLDGKISLDRAISDIKKATRHYIKRQETYFKREKRALWLDIFRGDLEDEIIRNLS